MSIIYSMRRVDRMKVPRENAADRRLPGCKLGLKDHRQRIPKNCYKMIFRKINVEENFFQLTFVTNEDKILVKVLRQVIVLKVINNVAFSTGPTALED